MNKTPVELSPEMLRHVCRPEEMAFTTTDEVDKLDGIIGQERATRAIEFGIDIEAEGYNIFAMGPSGAGKSSILKQYLLERAEDHIVPQDWAYVRNPNDAYRPRALALPTGQGRLASSSLRDVLRQIEAALTSAFSGSLYEEARDEVLETLQKQQQQLFRQLEAFAHQRSFALLQTPTGLTFAPMIDGKALSIDEFNRLSAEQREVFSGHEEALEEAMDRTMRALQSLQEETDKKLSGLNRKVSEATTAPIFESLRQRFKNATVFLTYLDEVEQDIIQRVVEQRLTLRPAEEKAPGVAFSGDGRSGKWTDNYELNLIVDHADSTGAPVIHEFNPSYTNLIGRIEYRAEFGALVPDHHTLRAGALHQANGGYLLIDARSLLEYPMAWEGLKRALRYKEIRIDEPAAQAGAMPAASLAPESIPLNVKVVLIGDPTTYYSLYAYDSAFEKLFKVRADFASDMEWSRENLMRIARFIRTRSDEEGLRAFDLEAVAQVVEYSARLVESQDRLTTRFAHVADIIREADYWANKHGAEVVGRQNVKQAIEERRYRSNLYEEQLQRIIEEGKLVVETEGRVVGQVNGLAVVSLGDYAFGKPSRITASTSLGNKGIINIERESKMSGRIHDKGVLILTGYLARHYGQDKPLNVNASIAFEQSYEGVDGDSASSTELYALLSSLSELPIEQGIAVTGSLNQHGDIQAIGGVTAKIEGFYDICVVRGLNGRQGVIIPAANVRDLMLREDIVEAVAAGKFHVWPVNTVDEGFSILSGNPSGQRDDDGVFPENSFNRLIDDNLREKAVALVRFSRDAEGKSKEDERNASEIEASVPEPSPEPPEPGIPENEP